MGWPAGKPRKKRLTAAHKAKIAAALKGRRRPPETLAKMAAAAMGNKACVGRKLSPETRQRIGKAQKGNQHSKGIKRSEAFRARLGERMKGNMYRVGWTTPAETRARQAASAWARRGYLVLPSPAPGVMGWAPDYKANRAVFFRP